MTYDQEYCRYLNICEVLILTNFARRANLRIHESRANYFYNSATKGKWKLVLNFVKTRKNLNTRKLPDLQYLTILMGIKFQLCSTIWELRRLTILVELLKTQKSPNNSIFLLSFINLLTRKISMT